MGKRFIFELIDVPYLAEPTISAIDVVKTAKKIQAYRKGGSSRNYDRVIKRISEMTTGLVTLEQINSALATEKDADWRRQLEDVAERLMGIFGKHPSLWYPSGRKPIEFFDSAWFKPAIRGVWFQEGQASATLINARKGLLLDAVARAFVARGIYEFHIVDDPNVQSFKIIDLGADAKGNRSTRQYGREEVDPMPLNEFEAILRKFMQALELAGFANQPSEDQIISDMFRRTRK